MKYTTVPTADNVLQIDVVLCEDLRSICYHFYMNNGGYETCYITLPEPIDEAEFDPCFWRVWIDGDTTGHTIN